MPKINRKQMIDNLEDSIDAIRSAQYALAAAPVFGEIRTLLQRNGKPIGNYDLLIASRAFLLDLTLVTNNTREFDRVPNLRTDNWLK